MSTLRHYLSHFYNHDDEMRQGRITGSIPARLRPALAARLAADKTISVEDAIYALAYSPIEADLAAAFPDAGPDAPTSSGFGPSCEAMPQSAAERAAADLEQFKAIARSLPIGGEGDVIKVAG